MLLLAVACTNDNAAQDNMPGTEPGTESLTAFVIEDNEPTTKAASTRTTGDIMKRGFTLIYRFTKE